MTREQSDGVAEFFDRVAEAVQRPGGLFSEDGELTTAEINTIVNMTRTLAQSLREQQVDRQSRGFADSRIELPIRDVVKWHRAGDTPSTIVIRLHELGITVSEYTVRQRLKELGVYKPLQRYVMPAGPEEAAKRIREGTWPLPKEE